MHGSVVSTRIRGFAGKKQSIINRLAQRFFHTISANFSVAIRSARERISLPIMAIRVFE